MKVRALFGAAALAIASIVGSTVLADIPINDSSEIVGTWKLVSVAPAINKPRIEENRTWEIRADGTIVTSGYNRHFKSEDRHEWKYNIVNGRLSADDPGRPGKTIDYTLYEKKGDEMILKGGLEGFYFFKRQ